MPVYEYECQKCGRISSFMEKMFERPRLFRRKRRCKHCGSKKLVKVVSSFSSKVERTQNEMMNELKSMGNVTFTPPPPKPPWGDGPPPGGCPYENAAKEDEAKTAKETADKKAKEPIVVR